MQVRDMRSTHWFWMDNAILDIYGPQLGAYGIAVYTALCRMANANGTCWPSLNTLASTIGISRSTVIRSLEKLESLGLISISHRNGSDGSQDTNIYTILAVGGSVSQKPGWCPTDTTLVSDVDSNNTNRTIPNEQYNVNGRSTIDGADPAPAVSFKDWIDMIKGYKDSRGRHSPNVALAKMCVALYGVDLPDFGKIGRVARAVGGPERLAQLLWENAARPPVGDVLDYIMAIKRNGKEVDAPEPLPEDLAPLAKAFRDETGIASPPDRRWKEALEEILNLAGDEPSAIVLIRQSVEYMRQNGLSIASPKSILAVARTLRQNIVTSDDMLSELRGEIGMLKKLIRG